MKRGDVTTCKVPASFGRGQDALSGLSARNLLRLGGARSDTHDGLLR